MDEYIEKHKVVNLLIELKNEFQQLKPFKGFEHAMYRKLCETGIAIGKLPAADVARVRHAEWVVCGDGDNVPWMCSHCGKTTAHKYKVIYGKYCPHCGAIMDGGADHEAD